MVDAPGTHGGPDAAGAAPHDFSTNANACGPCPTALAAVQAADASRYPDPQSTHLRAQLGAFHSVDPARIVIAASGSEFIARITAAVAQGGGRRVGLPAHSYGDYERAAQA
ncbi:MAG: aminotransferase, partial [Comamonadaceae bacterium]